MFDFDETYCVDARDGERVYVRLIPELDVVGFYKCEKLLFSIRAAETYDWVSNIAILTVYTKASDEDRDNALAQIADPGAAVEATS